MGAVRIIAVILALALATPASAETLWEATSGGATPIKLTASSRYGGAVYSLTYAGVQFIDAHDHGREMQTAVQWDGLGEAENPTQAGTGSDAGISSSVVKSAHAAGGVYSVETQMAYWHPWQGRTLSDTLVDQTYTMNWQGLPNVIHVDVTLTSPHAHSDMSLEALTAYLPGSFNRFYTMQTDGWHFVPQPNVTLVGEYVPIAVTNGTLSMGVRSTPGTTYIIRYYTPEHVAKWSVWHGAKPSPAGKTSYSLDIAVGNLGQIRQSFNKLTAMGK